MKLRRRTVVVTAIAMLAAAAAVVTWRLRRADTPVVEVQTIGRHDLEAVVSASGKIQPKRLVNISADTMGRVTNLAVEEGQRVAAGQFLLQIDPRNLRTAVERGQAGLEASESQLQQARVAAESARAALELAHETLARQRELWKQELTPREALDRAETDVRLREAELKEREAQVRTQELRVRQERASLEGARYDLSKVRIEAPITGIVTRRNIEEGETVVIGTMNNPGTVLLTIADMSVVEADIEVDETDLPSVAIGQPARVTVDALPNRTFAGRVTEIGNSPIQETGQAAAGQQATNFKVVVTLDAQIPEARPGFTCTAAITTATRSHALAVPIQAMAVRELVYDDAGRIVPEPADGTRSGENGAALAAELPPGQTRKETEGVFLVRDGVARFVPVETGIAGDRDFEVLSGLQAGDQVIIGPFAEVRELRDGDRVRIEERP